MGIEVDPRRLSILSSPPPLVSSILSPRCKHFSRNGRVAEIYAHTRRIATYREKRRSGGGKAPIRAREVGKSRSNDRRTRRRERSPTTSVCTRARPIESRSNILDRGNNRLTNNAGHRPNLNHSSQLRSITRRLPYAVATMKINYRPFAYPREPVSRSLTGKSTSSAREAIYLR